MPLPPPALLSIAALACLGCASGGAAAPAATSKAPAPSSDYQHEFVYVRGPGELDCASEVERARRQGEPAKIFLAQLRCKVYPAWKCPAACRADELLVTHVALRIDRQGQLMESRVMRASERTDFDEMCLAAVKGAAPFEAPPPRLLDGSGVAAFNIELACDCARRSPPP